MLAKAAAEPFNNPDWSFEPKMDGMRLLASVNMKKNEIQLLSRGGRDATQVFPALRKALAETQKRDLILDGEIIATDETGKPSFETLQHRINLTRSKDIERADITIPVAYYVFDILYLDGYDLRQVPLAERRRILETELIESPEIQIVASTVGDGEIAYGLAIDHGFEGIMAKRQDSAYESGSRSGAWLKVKSTRTDEFVIGGYTQGQGNRSDTFGSLLLGQYDEAGELQPVGHVGTGFDNRMLHSLISRLRPLETTRCPFTPKPHANARPKWLRPELMAEVRFAERTADNQLRAPVFMRLREDKPAARVVQEELVRPPGSSRAINGEYSMKNTHEAIGSALAALTSAGDECVVRLDDDEIHFTSLNKVLWPSSGRWPAITKRDLARYMLAISPYLLPYIHGRPLTLARYPDGVGGKHFFQRHWAHTLPAYVDTVTAFSEDNNGDVDFILCNNAATLMWLAQLGNLEIHAWFSLSGAEAHGKKLQTESSGSAANIEASALNIPDTLAFDLDPYIYSGKESAEQEPEFNEPAFAKTCEIAHLLQSYLIQLGLVPYVKTSGKTGLHIYVPINRSYTFDSTRAACETICRYILNERPKDITVDWSTAKRRGKIFLDYNMNARSKTIATVYSPRAIAGAGVSTPVAWEELDTIVPSELNIHTVPDRIQHVGDLWADIKLSSKNLLPG